MKILQVNKFYYPKDGVSNYLLGLKDKLEKSGHEVKVFAMSDPKNISTPEEKYFVSYLSFDQKGLVNTWRSFLRIFYSREAKQKFRSLVEEFNPDIIHIHNIYHQISPSILSIAKEKKIPVVMHLHDYKLICPNYKLFTKKKICKRCQGGKYYQCFFNKCLKNSFLKSFGGALEMYFHHQIWKIYEQGIDHFIAPSRFMKKTCEEFNWPAEKISWLHNFFNDQKINSKLLEKNKLENYLLYFGRLSEEKGVEIILKALLENNENLKIVGDGPEKNDLENQVSKLGLKERVEFMGFKSSQELEEIIQKAYAIIIPSIWLENMPLNMLESLAQGKIVLASNIGGIPEIIKHKQNGFLFTPGDSSNLANKIKALSSINYEQISQAAQLTVKDLNAAKHTKEIIKIYQTLIATKKHRC